MLYSQDVFNEFNKYYHESSIKKLEDTLKCQVRVTGVTESSWVASLEITSLWAL